MNASRHSNTVARRLTFAVILFSSLITLVSTAYQLYRDYHHDTVLIDARLQQIQDVHLRSITHGAWVLDQREVQLLLEGILNLPDMQYLEVKVQDEIWASVGVNSANNVITRQYPLIYSNLNRPQNIGMLTATATLDQVYQRLIDKAVVILISNGIKTFIVAGFVLLLFHFLITRHLSRIADFAQKLRVNRLGRILALERPLSQPGKEDELDYVVGAFNQMRQTLQTSYDALTDSEEKYRNIFENAVEGIFQCSMGGTFVTVNPAMANILGYASPEQLIACVNDIGQQVFVDQDACNACIAKLKTNGTIKNEEMQWRRKDGSFVWVSQSGRLVGDQHGNPLYYEGTLQDIDARKQAENQLHRAQRMEAIGQLTGGIAHDFNNLLGVMIGNAEMLEMAVTGDGQAEGQVEALIHAIDRASSLTSRLLSFSRQQTLSPVSTNISALVEGLEDMLQRTLGETIDLRATSLPNLWAATIDPHQFENALINLVINARDAMPTGGTMCIEPSNVTLDGAYAADREDVTPGDYVMVEISDTGDGIPESIIGNVFEPFFTTKDIGKGSGLGLSMVYGFVKQSKGHITIESETGRGTTVKLYLPRTEDSLVVDHADNGTQPHLMGSERILVVEDDENLRQISTTTLINQGYQVVDVKEGRDAVNQLNEGQSFDLIFTDVVLPGQMTGVEIAEHAKRIFPDIKILYTTGYAENDVIHIKSLETGMALVSKPFRKAELLMKVRELLN